MPPKDKLSIKYSDFDEFVMSSELMHWDKYSIFVDESKNKEPYTWGKMEVMADEHKFIKGPTVASNTGMIYYLEKYETFGEEDAPEEEINAILDRGAKAKAYKGFSIVM